MKDREIDRERVRESTRFWGVRIVGIAVSALVVGALLALLFGYFVMLLWNWIMPAVFGLGTITYWQGFGLVLLARLLFGGWSRDGGRGSRRGRKGRPLRDRVFMRVHAGELSDEDLREQGVYIGAIQGSRRRRRARYRDWWRDEGKAAFDAYVDRQEHDEGERNAEDS